ncbi:MAG: hypothetical protein Ct9H300mP11_22950 [Chloroflexota bacterium]|nr:MAG: hypothetical protein Ct9H300mP11_22950 [Chloroflexota bacterium]
MSFERKHIEEPSDPAGYLDRGNRYSRNGVYHKAIEDYTKAIELAPKFAEAYYHRGCSWYEVDKFDDSISDLTKAIEINPSADHYYGQRLSYTSLRTKPSWPKQTKTSAKICGLKLKKDKTAENIMSSKTQKL